MRTPSQTVPVHVAAPFRDPCECLDNFEKQALSGSLGRAPDLKNAAAPWPRPRCPQTARRCAWSTQDTSRVGKA